MKIPLLTRKPAGNVLMVALFVMAAMGIILASYLTMIRGQQLNTSRSEAWNRSLAIAENGIEEGLAHLNLNGSVSNVLGTQGWTAAGNKYTLHRDFSEGYFEASITVGLTNAVISSIGYVPAPGALTSAAGAMMAAAGNTATKYITRTIEVTCERITPFSKAIAAKDSIDLNGKNVVVDSYDSYNSGSSTNDGSGVAWGQYNAAKRRDNGDIAVIAGFKDDISISKAEVRGHAATGPGGSVDLSGKGVIGDNAWCDSNSSKGAKPGWTSSDANFTLPSVTLPFPFNSGVNPLGKTTIGGETYDYVFDTGDYAVGNLKGNVLIRGKARIIVSGKIDFDDDPKKAEGIELDDTARVEIYADCKDVTMTGKKHSKKTTSNILGINPGGNTTNLTLYGTDKCTKIELKSLDIFAGIIYAPNAAITLKTGSAKYYHANFHGAVSGKSVKLEKNASFHYDENIANCGPSTYVIASWTEK